MGRKKEKRKMHVVEGSVCVYIRICTGLFHHIDNEKDLTNTI